MGRRSPGVVGPPDRDRRAKTRCALVDVVTMREIEAILAITDRLGIHRESVVIPLAARHPGRVRLLPGGKIEIVVDSGDAFEDWLARLEPELKTVLG